MDHRRALQLLARMSVAGAAWAAALIVGLLAGVRLLPLWVATSVAAALVLPGFIVAVATTSGQRRRGRGWYRQLLRHLRPWARASSSGLFFAFWLAAMTSFMGIHGNAEIRGGQYVLDNHGTVTVVDKAAYDRQLAKEQRLFLGVLGGFGVMGAAINAAALARARSSTVEEQGRFLFDA